MEKIELTIFNGEDETSIMDRMCFSLMEIGIRMKRISMHDDYVVYEFVREERLGPPPKKGQTDKE